MAIPDTMVEKKQYAIKRYREGIPALSAAIEVGINPKTMDSMITEDDRWWHNLNSSPNPNCTKMPLDWISEWDYTRLRILKACGKI